MACQKPLKKKLREVRNFAYESKGPKLLCIYLDPRIDLYFWGNSKECHSLEYACFLHKRPFFGNWSFLNYVASRKTHFQMIGHMNRPRDQYIVGLYQRKSKHQSVLSNHAMNLAYLAYCQPSLAQTSPCFVSVAHSGALTPPLHALHALHAPAATLFFLRMVESVWGWLAAKDFGSKGRRIKWTVLSKITRSWRNNSSSEAAWLLIWHC